MIQLFCISPEQTIAILLVFCSCVPLFSQAPHRKRICQEKLAARLKGWSLSFLKLECHPETIDPYPIHARLTVNLETKGNSITLEAEVVYNCTFDEGPFKEPGMGNEVREDHTPGSNDH